MIRSILIGALAGMRAMTPLAAVAVAARRKELPQDTGAPAFLGHPATVAGTLAMAVGEIAGDKIPSAPDRVIAPGIAARLVTGAVAGAALAPRPQRMAGASLGAAAAVASAYLTWRLRLRAMQRFGQTSTGAVEDAVMLLGTTLVIRGVR